MTTTARVDLTRIFLVILIIAVLIVGSLWTLLPFMAAIIWAATIVIATWPMLLRAERWAGGRRSVATALLTIVMLAMFIVPFGLAIGVLIDAASEGIELVRKLATQGLPALPSWVSGVPWVGPKIALKWQELTAGGPEAVASVLRPYAASTANWVLSITGGLGAVTLHFLLTIVIAAILYTNGEATAKGILLFAHRIGGERGERSIRLAGQAIRGVALGVVLTAIVESIIAGLGLWLAGVPRPGLLVALIFVLAVAQLGPMPVLIPAVIWLFWSGSIVWGVVLVVFTVVVAVVDNVMKPVLIRRGVDLPLLLIVAGVIGGLIGFGVIGLFIGPVILAVTYTLLESWITEPRPDLA
ncbi:MAG TPA: AI-2E family transporter YdiK [Steroidobacteraceae bacterium]|nr:AI-2E family transporter YdiK [Steroidobacteraceae bacterium]